MKGNRLLLLVFLGGLLGLARPAEASIGMGNFFHELLERVQSALESNPRLDRENPVVTTEPRQTRPRDAVRRTRPPRVR